MLECARVGKLLSLKALRRISDPVAPVNARSCCESNTLSNPAIVRDVLGNGLRLLTERMTQVRSISIGVWLTRGSRHETAERGGIAHFVEHMLFKGTTSRSAEDIAQAIDSIGGQLDAFTAKEYASYYIKVLDEHLPLAIDILSDIVRNPAFSVDDLEREKKVVVEEIKMVEDTPDDLVHELFTQGFWENHALGRPILGTRETVESFNADLLRDLLHERVHGAQPHRVGGGQPGTRARPRAHRGEVRIARADRRAARPKMRRRSCRRR